MILHFLLHDEDWSMLFMVMVFSQLILCPIFASNVSITIMLFAIACIPASVWLSVDVYVIRKVQFSQTLLAHSILKLASYIPLFITKSMQMRKRKGKRMNEHGSCMCVAFLNASRAFDGVNITMLFSMLLKRNVPKWIIEVIAQWYCNQSVCVRWDQRSLIYFSFPIV